MIVEVTYETSPSATALQWLTPEQTAGKRAPYLFSQCQVGVALSCWSNSLQTSSSTRFTTNPPQG